MVYVHIPFCESFCIYCDFYSELCSGHEDKRELFVSSLLKEIEERRSEIAATEGVDTLYFGGGTPSVLTLPEIEKIVNALGRSSYNEFTIEVNPEDILKKGEQYVRGLLEMGVNRISMGVQSFDDGILRFMRRRHSAEGAREAFRILRSSGVKNISVDLIFGLSNLEDKVWAHTIGETLKMAPEHISAYQLSIEEDSALGKLVRAGKYDEAGEEQCRSQYDFLCEALSAAGYEHYEVSNFALPGCQAVHNSAYWQRKPYVGLGPGAHSFDGGETRSWNKAGLGPYSRESEALTPRDLEVEQVMLALRTALGIEEKRIPNLPAAGRLLEKGSLERLPGGRIRIPESSFFVSDEIIRELI